jgi:hypothetical protein
MYEIELAGTDKGKTSNLQSWFRAGRPRTLWMLFICLSANISALAQSPPSMPGSTQVPTSPPMVSSARSGSVSGIVVDQDGALVGNAKVTLTQEGASAKRDAVSDAAGHFVFADLAPGPFQLSITASGFATSQISGVLHAGENYTVPQITLTVAQANVDVNVTLSPAQVAEEEVKEEEKQRVLGVIPNFYVTYIPNPAPLTPKLKFQLAWKSIVNPFTFGITGAIAGIEQASNSFSGYGPGAEGYGKRYGAAYADLVTGSLIGGAILPSLLKQDPRYFYKGTGSRRSRVFYAIARSVTCKGDNGRWQPNYSSIIGGLAAGGISNLYYPAQNRSGVSLTFENALIGIGGTAAGNILQEFVVRRFTPHLPGRNVDKP